MEPSSRWAGRTAVVTGASAGIGAAICLRLANTGLRVVGLARRPELIDKLKSKITGTGSILSRQCDVSQQQEVAATFKWIDESLGGTDVLVNNAGVFHSGHFTDLGNDKLSDEKLFSIIDINLKGSIMCARHALDSMTKRGFHGHIVNINSLAGHYIPFSSGFNVYPGTKYAITAFTNGLLNELADLKSNIKVTSISPGVVATEMTDPLPEGAAALSAHDVADALLYVLAAPPGVNIAELTITAVSDKRL